MDEVWWNLVTARGPRPLGAALALLALLLLGGLLTGRVIAATLRGGG